MTSMIGTWVLACMGTIATESVQLEIWSTHDRLSECHMASTERGLDHVNQQCYCVERTDD
jgi:hypothetical protein